MVLPIPTVTAKDAHNGGGGSRGPLSIDSCWRQGFSGFPARRAEVEHGSRRNRKSRNNPVNSIVSARPQCLSEYTTRCKRTCYQCKRPARGSVHTVGTTRFGSDGSATGRTVPGRAVLDAVSCRQYYFANSASASADAPDRSSIDHGNDCSLGAG